MLCQVKYQLPHCLLTILVFFTTCIQAQIVKIDTLTHWKKSFRTGLNLNQASFTSNWKAGGVNSIGFNTLLNFKANYKNGKNSWDNEIDLLYGMVNNQGQGYRKTMDRIFMDTRYGRSVSEHWDFSVAANLQSQFAPGYKYVKDSVGVEHAFQISDLAAPAYVTVSIGFEYHPAPYFKLRLSPMAPRLTVVNDVNRFVTLANPKPYGLMPNTVTRYEWLAFQMLAEFNKDIATNVNLKWRYILFANYETLSAKTLVNRLDLNLTAKVNKFVNVTLGGILLYDYNQDPGIQLSEAFSLGILYSFQNFEDKK